MFRENKFKCLPVEMLFKIYSYLSPEQTAIVAAADTTLHNIIKGNNRHGNLLWENKFQRHFPHLYKVLTSQEKENINWYVEFLSTYDIEYQNIELAERRLFSLVKESDIEGLRAEEALIQALLFYTCNQDTSNNTLICWAQKIGNQPVLNYLYQTARKNYLTENEYLIDVSKYDKYGRTILYWALACHQSYELIQALISKGSKLDEKYFGDRYQPIHIAAQEGLLDVVKGLITKIPALLEAKDNQGQTPLLWAAVGGHIEVLDYLITQRPNLNVSTQNTEKSNGKTPLHWALSQGHAKAASKLLRAGAIATTAQELNQSQPIHLAAKKGFLEIVQTLLEKNPELLEVIDKYRQTPLLLAAANGHIEVLDYLITQRADLNVSTQNTETDNGKTPLHWALDLEHAKAASKLLSAGAIATTAQDQDQFQSIHFAAKNGFLEIVQTLLEKNPELLEQIDSRRQTPLLYAAAKGHAAIVDYLISKKANLNVSSHDPSHADHGKTPLCWAISHGHNEVVRTLLEAGMIPSLTNPIDKSKLNEEMKVEVELLEHPSKRRRQI